MANRTITLTDIKIQYWRVDVEQRCVYVSYRIIDDRSETYRIGEAIFWETIPDVESPPDFWYQLPAAYSDVLTDLTLDVRQALLHLIQE